MLFSVEYVYNVISAQSVPQALNFNLGELATKDVINFPTKLVGPFRDDDDFFVPLFVAS
jgi:hypothetical protein